jgi:hypothetical protein
VGGGGGGGGFLAMAGAAASEAASKRAEAKPPTAFFIPFDMSILHVQPRLKTVRNGHAVGESIYED